MLQQQLQYGIQRISIVSVPSASRMSNRDRKYPTRKDMHVTC